MDDTAAVRVLHNFRGEVLICVYACVCMFSLALQDVIGMWYKKPDLCLPGICWTTSFQIDWVVFVLIIVKKKE